MHAESHEEAAMTTNTRMENLYQQITLVRGAGDRSHGKLCIMSFVAFLAGEGHSDDPATASAVIRRFAITINDEMPDHFRQRLKPFAPRIIGTRDGHDRVRADLLIDAVQLELLPQIAADFSDATAARIQASYAGWKHRRPESLAEFRQRVIHMVLCAGDIRDTYTCQAVASAVARLIAFCARTAGTSAQREWYWLKAIELLDRLCDVGSERGRPQVSEEHLAEMAEFLERRGQWAQRRSRAMEAFVRVRNLFPVLIG